MEDPWIPCMHADGSRVHLAPWEIFDRKREIKLASLATSRPDFQGSIVQFLIGLAQTTMAPASDFEWLDALQKPPDPSFVRERFATVAPAFNLGGDGSLFMQDPSCSDGDEIPIEWLVIGMPGDNTLKLNRDFFSKRNTVQNLCPACAALALMTLQINGPQGGKGHMTGLRGGGPLTTVILGDSLAETIWLNVLPESEFFAGLKADRKSEMHDIFPWMSVSGPGGGSTRGRKVSITDASQLQMFWGTGRRILLETGKLNEAICDICGEHTDSGISSYKTKPYGIQYDESWRHVLTPYYRKKEKEKETMLPVHLSREGIVYRHWLGIVQNDPEEGREIARVVSRFHRISGDVWGLLPKTPRLWAFGYDFDKVKARCWYDSVMPLLSVKEEIREEYERNTAQVIRAAQYSADVVHGAVKDALYSKECGEKTIAGPLLPGNAPSNIPIVKVRFWAETESLFYQTIGMFKSALESGEPVEPVKAEWVKDIRATGLSLFDFYAQAEFVDEVRPCAVVKARKRLAMTLSPGSPRIGKILGLPRKVAR
ncbi:MAG TPA: type I-E CRISPR-associated protein Cse1/CasA [Methanoregulaceae archaeon]|nr:type I-E CRISPR-associated protein Cse1/CasA [Methanolinea sp.]HOU80704.1 type I-E CRISPR-associated protein Cse1/CasA [Methanoregulaceae archaeon]HQJ39581.1 type I-E CRISPR-associated protein Cse1/CasA [Methanoregulaceae archaeon]